MTLALDRTECGPQLHTSIQLMRAVIINAGCGLPAAALTDSALANWVRSHSVTVTARDENDLDLLRYNGIRPVQIVYRCGPTTAPIRRAVALGVSRFIVNTPQQMARVAEGSQDTKYIYLDEDAPLVLGDRRLRVIGFHGDVDHSGGAVEWASAAERLLCRSAVLKTCGSPIKRIALTGGSTDIWLEDSPDQLTSIVSAVDEALRNSCERWRLARPAVTLSPLNAGRGLEIAELGRKRPRGMVRFRSIST